MEDLGVRLSEKRVCSTMYSCPCTVRFLQDNDRLRQLSLTVFSYRYRQDVRTDRKACGNIRAKFCCFVCLTDIRKHTKQGHQE